MIAGEGHLAAARHIVRFCATDSEFTHRAGSYLRDALSQDGAAVAITTAPHRRAVGNWLADAGVDVAAARSEGRYLDLDARETLARFTTGGRPDRRLFQREAGALVRAAGRAGRGVHAFGEMAALLWDDGDLGAALELERLWNELARTRPVSLCCAYAASSVAGHGRFLEFARMCQLHDEIASSPAPAPDPPGVSAVATASRSFTAGPVAPRDARVFVGKTLSAWGVTELANDAALVVTELATNAVVHARSGFTVMVIDRGDTIRVSVRDSVPLPLEPRGALTASPAHGLGVIAALAAGRWGAQPLGHSGKVIWAELAR